ncbi:MAG TPA: nitrate reductase associated protein [Polyangiaceae bacterium]|nr:nitrate reductase associated protein [Polyangiaceae bacterium]
MSWDGIYIFESESERNCWLPMAARRALDMAGIHVSLEPWKGLSAEQRQGFINLGRAPTVDVAAVGRRVEELGLASRPEQKWTEPGADEVPRDVQLALAPQLTISKAEWSQLSPLDRYTLYKLASRERTDKAKLAWREIRARSFGK